MSNTLSGAIARDLGWTGGSSSNPWCADLLVDVAVAYYWERRIVHGPRCGTAQGFGDHGLGPTCQPCQAAEQWAVLDRRAAA